MTGFHSFRLDRANQCLWHLGVRVDLTPKAFDVLRYLVDHRGRLVTAVELLDALWPGTYVNPEGLRNYIREIRKALGDRPEKPLFIRTVPKRGYVFIAPIADENSLGPLPGDTPKKIVDREPTLAELHGCFRDAMRAQRQIVFITGEVGIGKTAVVDELERQISNEVPDVRIARGQCLEGYGGKEAYYAILEALGQLCQGTEGDAVVELLGTQAPTWLLQFPALVKREHREMLQREIIGATRRRMVREISDLLETLSSEKPLLLVVDDLQWGDVSTLDVISALARRRRTAKLMFIGIYRPVDVLVSNNPLNDLKQDLLVHRLCSEIALGPLDEASMREFLGAQFGGATVPEGLARFIYRYSEGNPLFMLAVLEHMQDRDLIAIEGGRWQIKVPLETINLDTPESLGRMIELQIERLRAEEQRVLEAASLQSIDGSRFSVAARSAVAGLQPEVFGEVCERLSRRHRILCSAGLRRFDNGIVSPCYAFVHELYREVCYRRIPPARRPMLHRLLGEWVEAHYESLSESAAWLAGHFELAGDWARAIKYLQLAADTAARRFEQRQAAEILKHALKLVQSLPETARKASEIQILEKLAMVYVVLIDGSNALATYEALTARAAHDGSVGVEVQALTESAWVVSWTSSERSLEILERSLSLSSQLADPLIRATAQARCFAVRLWQRWNSHDAEAFHSAFAEILKAGERHILAPYLADRGFVYWLSSAYREARQSLIDSRDVQLETVKVNPYPTSSYLFGQRFFLPMNYLFLGEWGEAVRWFEETIAVSDKNGDYVWGQALRLFLAFLHVCAMDFAGALAMCNAALPLVGDPWPRPAPDYPAPYPIHLRVCLTVIGLAKIGLGKYESALKHLVAAKADERPRAVWDWWWQMPLEAALTELSLQKGDIPQARRQAEKFLSTTLATAERTWQALAWEANARAAIAELDLTRAQECIANGLTTMDGFVVPVAAWRVHATAFEIYSNLGDLDAAERHLALSRETIMQLANSLPAGEPLRQIFLAAPKIREILDRERSRVRAKEA